MAENPEILRIEDLTRRLDRVNADVEHLLNRIPLTHFRKLAQLNQLINEQNRLASTPPRWPIPPRVTIFFDNARNKASYLRQRYNEAYMNGNLRKPCDD